MKAYKLALFVLVISLLPLAIATEITIGGTSISNGKVINMIPPNRSVLNDSTFNVNNSLFLNGYNSSHFVPYVGADRDVRLGTKNLLTTENITVGGLNVTKRVLSDLLPIPTLALSLGSGAARWLSLFVQNISAENIETYNIHATNNLTVDGYTRVGNLNVSGNLVVDGNMSVRRPYGMYSSTQTQNIAAIGVAQPVTFNWTEDSYEIFKSNDSANFTFLQQGDYLIELSAIMQTTTPGDRVEIWVQKTNVSGHMANVRRSNTIYDFKSNNANTVIAVPFIIDMNTSDTMRIMVAGSSTNIKMQYYTNTTYSPETPSIIMTMTKLSEVTP
ncbi:hypothetical protein M0R04_14610 [Candidatus Dojkabacteria bacterium]|nr:hypothetical protein [Candidatus Dojkabacteria bacterium]